MAKNVKCDEIIRQIRDVGQSLIDNAETIAGGYEFQTGTLRIHVEFDDREPPVIDIGQSFLPEQFYRRKKEHNP